VAKAVGRSLAAGAITQIVDDATGATPQGCSVTASNGSVERLEITFNTAANPSRCGDKLAMRIAEVNSFVNTSIAIDPAASTVKLTLSGPASVWFAVGYGGVVMKGTYAVVVDGSGHVTERALGDHTSGDELASSVTVASSSMTDGIRTIVLTRSVLGASPSHFSFNTSDASVALITAVGSGPTLAYHREKTTVTAWLLPTRAPNVSGACVCARAPLPFGQGKGSFVYTPVAGDKGERGQPTTVDFYNKCAAPPRGDLLAQNNPTCDVRTYTGGQTACHHMWSLLDADQPIPWPDKPIKYSLKWRFWYQEYDPTVHNTVQYSSLGKYTDWSIGAGPMSPGFGAEYDVPKCADGVPGCSRDSDTGTWVHTITGVFTVKGGAQFANTGGKILPVVAHLHCHAPTCLSMAVFDNATGALLCEEVAVYGNASRSDKFSEPGYIAVPPCLWGSPEHGLEAPIDISNITLRVVKRANATYGHHGEMAHGEIYYVDTPARD